MNRRLTVGALVAAALVVAGSGTTAVAASSATPPWEPDANAVGTITFYDSSGNVITHGSTTAAPFAAYAVGSAAPQANGTHAVMRASYPRKGAQPSGFTSSDLSAFTAYPIASGSAPANIVSLSASEPVATGSTGDQTLASFEQQSTSTDPGYEDVVQIRLVTANASGAQSAKYDDADLLIDPTTGTWQEEYPTQTVVTQDDSSLSISAPRTVRYGTDATVSTKATDTTANKPIPDQSLSLLERASSRAAWHQVAKATTNGSGSASAKLRLTANEQFEWTLASSPTHKGATSPVAGVGVTQQLTIAASPGHIEHGARTSLFGEATPAGSGQTVTVQELVGRKWKNVGTVKIKKQKLPNHRTAVGYSVSVRLTKRGTYSFRAVKGATSTLLGVTSGTVKVRVK